MICHVRLPALLQKVAAALLAANVSQSQQQNLFKALHTAPHAFVTMDLLELLAKILVPSSMVLFVRIMENVTQQVQIVFVILDGQEKHATSIVDVIQILDLVIQIIVMRRLEILLQLVINVFAKEISQDCVMIVKMELKEKNVIRFAPMEQQLEDHVFVILIFLLLLVIFTVRLTLQQIQSVLVMVFVIGELTKLELVLVKLIGMALFVIFLALQQFVNLVENKILNATKLLVNANV